jgi:hypothetical protein
VSGTALLEHRVGTHLIKASAGSTSVDEAKMWGLYVDDMLVYPALRESECLVLDFLTGNLRERTVAAKRVRVNKRTAGFISQKKAEGEKERKE